MEAERSASLAKYSNRVILPSPRRLLCPCLPPRRPGKMASRVPVQGERELEKHSAGSMWSDHSVMILPLGRTNTRGKRTQMQSDCNFINKRGYSEITTTKRLESKTKTYFNRDTEGITGTGLTINGPTNNTQGTWTIYRHTR